jgi:hypothetical protein
VLRERVEQPRAVTERCDDQYVGARSGVLGETAAERGRSGDEGNEIAQVVGQRGRGGLLIARDVSVLAGSRGPPWP